MTGNFVPEMHDIGKLINDDAIQASLDIPTVMELADLTVARQRLGMPRASNEEVAREILDRYEFDGHLFAFRSPQKEERGFKYDIPLRLTKPEPLTYQVIRAHLDAVADNDVLAKYPMHDDEGKVELFLLILADHLASSISRATVEEAKGKPGRTVSVLWRGRGPYPKGTVETIENLKDMLKFIAEDPSSAEWFLKKYGYPLRNTPEEKRAPRDATSLYTHIRLVGQFYRVLKASLESASGELPPRYSGQTAQSLIEVEGKKKEAGKWHYRLLWCKVRFPQALTRARDLNVFILRERCLSRIIERWRDNVLLHTADSLTLFLPKDVSSAQVLRPLLVRGFFVESIELTGDPGSLSTERVEEGWLRERRQALEGIPESIDRLEAEREETRREVKRLYDKAAEKGILQNPAQKEAFERDVIGPLQEKARALVEQAEELRRKLAPYERVVEAGPRSVYHHAVAETATIAPPICELCQLRPGTYGWIPTQRLPLHPEQAADQPVEYLCKQCFTIRQMGYAERREWRSGKMFHRLESWSEDNLPVAWVRVCLNHEVLGQAIRRLFDEYVDEELADEDESYREAAKLGLRSLPLKADFIADYHDLLLEFRDLLRDLFEADRKEEIGEEAEYPELYVLQVESGREVLNIIGEFEKTIKKLFPKCYEDSPILLAVSIAGAKHPYMDHWRFLESPNDAVNVQIPRQKAKLELSLPRFNELRKGMKDLGQRRVRGFLHHLAEIERKMGWAIVTARIREQKKRLPSLWELIKDRGFSAQEILSYFKIVTF